MAGIEDYFSVTQLDDTKDYSKLADRAGFLVTDGPKFQASINTHCCAQYVALLQFDDGEPRGNHYHHEKIEYMTPITGALFCRLELVDDASAGVREFVLDAGQMLRILPECVHTYTAIGGTVIALEFSPQKFDNADTIEIEAE